MNKGDRIKILGYSCGRSCNLKFLQMGIIKGTEMEVVSVQPIGGPIVVKVGNAEYTIGRGMMSKLEYEIIE